MAAVEGRGEPGRPTPSTYVSGERVFGPPRGTLDVDWLAREVERSTSATFADAHAAVAAAWRQARLDGGLEPEALIAAARAAGASAEVASTTTAYVTSYCTTYEVDPAER